MIQIKPIPAFNDNYIWCLFDDQSKQAVIVDPGDATPVIEALQASQLELVAILITHHHFDHTGGIDGLLEHYSVPVYGPDSDKIPQISVPLTERDSFSVLGLQFEVLTIPGHTLDHIALYCAESATGPLVFCGDTLFAGGCGRLFEGDPAMMLQSLNKLAALPATTQVFCAHEYTMANLKFAATVEPNNQQLQQRLLDDGARRQQQQPTIPSTIATELQTNPFLRCSEAAVISSAAGHSGQNPREPVEVFGLIRAWKDNF
jgi:hydroxyacylglutathione hydrolase